MKTIFKLLFATVITSMAMWACTEQPVNPVESVPETVTLNFESGDDAETRTYIDENNNAFWHQSGETLKVFESVDGAASTIVTSKEGQVNGKKATFAATFTANTTGESFVYNAIYPSSAYVGDDVTKVKVETPSAQNPTLISFDPAADLLIARPVVRDAQPTAEESLTLNFARIVAIGKMVITDLAEGDVVTSIKFTTDDVNIAGRSYVNLTESSVETYGYANQGKKEIELTYDPSLNFVNNSKAIFTCFPCELNKFTVTVTTATKKYTKVCAVPEGGNALTFKAGKSTKFTVSMTGATVEDYVIEDFSGTYAIAVKKNESYHALTGTSSDGNRLDFYDIDDFVNLKYTNNSDIIWEIEKATNGYTVKNNNKYLYNQNTDKNYANTSEASQVLLITKNENGTYQIKDGSRILASNSNDKKFGFYSSGQNNELIFVAIEEDSRTLLTPPVILEAKVVEDTPNSVKLTWNTVENAVGYEVSYEGLAEPVSVTELTYTFEGLTWNKTYSFTVTAKAETGSAEFKDSEPSEAVEISIGADPDAQPGEGGSEGTGKWVEVTDYSSVTSGLYIHVTIATDGKYYYMSSNEALTSLFKPGNLSVLPDDASFVATDDMKLTLDGDNTNGFTITGGGNTLTTIAANNGMGFSPSRTGTYASKWIIYEEPTTSDLGYNFYFRTVGLTSERYAGLYLTTPNYRAYKSTTESNICNHVYKLYKYTEN